MRSTRAEPAVRGRPEGSLRVEGGGREGGGGGGGGEGEKPSLQHPNVVFGVCSVWGSVRAVSTGPSQTLEIDQVSICSAGPG